MKKLFYFLTIMLFIISSCTQEDIPTNNSSKSGLSKKNQEMRQALELSTSILVEMISNNQTYFDELNKIIVAGSPEYLEDRVMLKDLFNSTSKTTALRVKANSNKFTSDFKTGFNKNKPQKIGGINGINSNAFSNPDSLIQYLTDNNVILNCPYPLEDYDEDNRIPAITFDPLNNDTANVGYLFDKLGNITEVHVNQAYADKHPVWILIPNQPEMKNQPASIKAHKAKSATTDGFRTTINRIYLTEYYCTFFVPALNMRILRSGNGFSWNNDTKNYTGTFAQMNTFEMPRKYVKYAKDRKLDGWYPINIEWDYDWYSDKKEQALSVYEHDRGDPLTLTTNIKVTIPGVGEAGVTISGSFTNKDDIITLQPLGRDHLYNVATHGHKDSSGKIDWVWTEVLKRNFWGVPTHYQVHTQIYGKYIYYFDPSFMMTFTVQQN